MATKTSYDQHNLLHKHFPCDCCLCKAEVKIAKLEKANDNIKPIEGLCYYCNKPVNHLSANPSEWGIPLCHSDEPGKVKPHHIGCVSDRLDLVAKLEKELAELKAEGTRSHTIRDCEGMD